MSGLGTMNTSAGSGGVGMPRPSPSIPNLKSPQQPADASFVNGRGRRDCFHDAMSADCEFHGNLVRDIIRSRREERRARLQQRCRPQSNEALAMSAAAAAVSASRNVTPLRRRPSQSSTRASSPRSTMSSDFLPCVSPLMEDLILEITDAIESSGLPECNMTPQMGSALVEMDNILRLIDEAQREYESLAPRGAQGRFDLVGEPGWMREDCWGSLLEH